MGTTDKNKKKNAPTASAPKAAAAAVDVSHVSIMEYTDGFGQGEPGVVRDWNEEYQCSKELPRETVNDCINRQRALIKVQTDFTEAATRGAVAITEGHVAPINPMEVP